MMVRKLQSRRGMSIIMGLLLLLVCATAGAAALTSAASNAGRYTHLRRDQQRYLAVASAARTVRDELCAGKYEASATFTKTVRYYSTTDPETGAVSWHTRPPVYDLTDTGSYKYNSDGTPHAFNNWLGEHMKKLFRANEVEADRWTLSGGTPPADPGPLSYTDLKVQVDGEDPLLSRVRWSLTLSGDYTLTARLWLEEDDGAVYYNTILTVPAHKTTSETTTSSSSGSADVTTSTQKLTVTWPLEDAVIQQN